MRKGSRALLSVAGLLVAAALAACLFLIARPIAWKLSESPSPSDAAFSSAPVIVDSDPIVDGHDGSPSMMSGEAEEAAEAAEDEGGGNDDGGGEVAEAAGSGAGEGEEEEEPAEVHAAAEEEEPAAPPPRKARRARPPAEGVQPVTLRPHRRGAPSPTTSGARCVGNDFSASSWVTRTCHFRNLCLDTSSKTWTYFASRERSPPAPEDMEVSLGPVNPAWLGDPAKNPALELSYRFKPAVEVGAAEEYAERKGLALLHGERGDLALIYHEMCAANVGHLLWDEFFVWYQMARLFGLENSKRLLPLRATIPEPFWATCDWIKIHDNGKDLPRGYYKRCTDNYERWLPAMLGEGVRAVRGAAGDGSFWRGTRVAGGGAPERSKALVCFPHAVAGAGMLSDHCLQDHGQDPRWQADRHPHLNGPPGESLVPRIHGPTSGSAGDASQAWSAAAAVMCNMGRGPAVWGWRERMLGYLLPVTPAGVRGGDPQVEAMVRHLPPRGGVLLATHSKLWGGMGFEKLQKNLEAHGVAVVSAKMASLSPAQQAELTSRVAVVVTESGGSSVTATFLRDGGGLMLCFRPHASGSPHGSTGRLDWQLWEHVGYVKTAWVQREDCVAGGGRALESVLGLLAHAQGFLQDGAGEGGGGDSSDEEEEEQEGDRR